MDDAFGELGGNGTKTGGLVYRKNGVRFAISVSVDFQLRRAGN